MVPMTPPARLFGGGGEVEERRTGGQFMEGVEQNGDLGHQATELLQLHAEEVNGTGG